MQYAGKANIHLRMLYMSKKTYPHARSLKKPEKSILDRFFVKLFKDLQLALKSMLVYSSIHQYTSICKKIFPHI